MPAIINSPPTQKQLPRLPKSRFAISPPLEAGPSPTHRLPSNVIDALEYASRRLAKKATHHITLLAITREYELPEAMVFRPKPYPSPPPTQTKQNGEFGISSGRPFFSSIPGKNNKSKSKLDALKQLVRGSGLSGSSDGGDIRERIVHVHRDAQYRRNNPGVSGAVRGGNISPAWSEASANSSVADSTLSSPRTLGMKWPGSPVSSMTSPTTPGSVPLTPATPWSVVSDAESKVGTEERKKPFGIRLTYAHPLEQSEEKALAKVLEKAGRRFKVDPLWLPTPIPPSHLSLPVDLVLASTAQNDRLFTSDRLTLLTLDHVYTFRAALLSYSRSSSFHQQASPDPSPSFVPRIPAMTPSASPEGQKALEDAVDELRKLFLANGRKPLKKATLMAAYRWIGPPDCVMEEVFKEFSRVYRRVYAAIEERLGIFDDEESDQDVLSLRNEVAVPVVMKREQKKLTNMSESPRLTPMVEEVRQEQQRQDLLGLEEPERTAKDTDTLDFEDIEAWYRAVQDIVIEYPAPQNKQPLSPLAGSPTKKERLFSPRPAPLNLSHSNILPTPSPTSTSEPKPEPLRPKVNDEEIPPSPTSPPPAPTTATLPPFPWREMVEEAEKERQKENEKQQQRKKDENLVQSKVKGMGLKLQTKFEKPIKKFGVKQQVVEQDQVRKAKDVEEEGEEEEEEEEDGDLTARPLPTQQGTRYDPWSNYATPTAEGMRPRGRGVPSIDGMLLENQGLNWSMEHYRLATGQYPITPADDEDDGVERVGPKTPNGDDDISPITRGEWGFLIGGVKRRLANVGRC